MISGWNFNFSFLTGHPHAQVTPDLFEIPMNVFRFVSSVFSHPAGQRCNLQKPGDSSAL
jgi:hypothetical protein